jgi:hypothetical protein
MLAAASQDLLILLGICLTGYLAVQAALRKPSGIEMLGFVFPLGAGILTWLFFVTGWLGFPFSRASVLLIWLLVNSLFGILIFRRSGWQGLRWPRRFLPAPDEDHRPAYLALALIGAGFLVSLTLAVGRSYSVYDGIAMWAPKGYGIAMERSLWGARWGNHGYSYPFHIHFLIATFRLFSGDLLPGSKTIFPTLFFSLLLGVYGYWLQKGVKAFIRTASIVILMTAPTLFTFSTIGYPNLPMATYLVLGVIAALKGIERGDAGYQVLSGMLLGFMAWTVIEGMLYLSIVIPTIIIGTWLSRRGRIRIIPWIGPAVLVWGVWYVFFRQYGAGGSQALQAGDLMLEALRTGDWRLSDARLVLGYARRNVFDLDSWGFIYYLGVIFSLIGWKQMLPRRDFAAFTLLLVTGTTAALSLGLFYLRSFFIPGLYELLERSFPRGFMSPSILFFLLAISLAGKDRFEKSEVA